MKNKIIPRNRTEPMVTKMMVGGIIYILIFKTQIETTILLTICFIVGYLVSLNNYKK